MWEVWIFQTLTKLLREFFARNFSRFLNWFSSLFDNYLCNYLCYFVFWNSPSSPSENSFGNANRFGNSIQLFFWCIFSISLENFSTNAFRNPVDKLFEEYFGNFFKKNPCRRNLHLFFEEFCNSSEFSRHYISERSWCLWKFLRQFHWECHRQFRWNFDFSQD